MKKLSIEELLRQAAPLYRRIRSRKEKSHYLEQLQQLTGYKSTKTLIRKLSLSKTSGKRKKRGRTPLLKPTDITLLKKLWLVMDQPCGKRFKSMLPEWLEAWQKENKTINPEQQYRLLQASSATLDRALREAKITFPGKKHYNSASGALRSQIPLIDVRRQISQPGHLYADTVAHCAESTAGSFAWTLTLTDDLTQWSLMRAVWNKGQHAVCKALSRLLNQLPFKARSINTDNGSEFINYHLQKHLKGKQPKCQISRSRPYKKNDNARAEEKNRHKVRDLIGHDRLDDEGFVVILNQIYRSSNLLNNHFMACSRVVSKTRLQGKLIKKHDLAQTPYQRVISTMKSGRKREKLEQLHHSLNPLQLRRNIEEGLSKLYALLNRLNSN